MQQWEGARNNPGKNKIKKVGLLQNWDCGDENLLYDRGGSLPREACRFILDQMVAYGYAVNQELMPVMLVGATAAFNFVGYHDPYSMYLLGLSDVSLSDSWCNCSYEINPGCITYDEADAETQSDTGWEEFRHVPSPDEVESYEYTPEQGEAAFQRMLASPGLGHLPHGIGERIRDILHGDFGSEDRYASLTSDQHMALKNVCSYTDRDGNIRYDTIRMDLYFECAAWAAFVWLMSPLSLGLRCSALDLTAAAYNQGEAILVDPGFVYGSYSYIKRDLPPEVCYVRGCGVMAYCVGMTLVGDQFAYICEHCKSYGEELFLPANCGSRVCKAASCHHHPLHGMGKQLGTHEVLRKSGILLRQGNSLGGLLGGSSHNPLLLS